MLSTIDRVIWSNFSWQSVHSRIYRVIDLVYCSFMMTLMALQQLLTSTQAMTRRVEEIRRGRKKSEVVGPHHSRSIKEFIYPSSYIN